MSELASTSQEDTTSRRALENFAGARLRNWSPQLVEQPQIRHACSIQAGKLKGSAILTPHAMVANTDGGGIAAK